MLRAEIDGLNIELEEKISILDAAKKANINIPTLCYEDGLSIYGGCRLCVVEVEGEDLLKPACATEIEEGMKIKTHSKKVRDLRKNLFELIIATHNIDCQLNCLTCSRASNCELKDIAEDIGLSKMRLDPIKRGDSVDNSSYAVIREPEKCISCNRCIRKCEEVQGIGIFTTANRGPETVVTTFKDRGMGNVECTNCGQCILSCPTGALHELYQKESVLDILNDETKHVVVQTAPAVRVAISEPFSNQAGDISTGQLVTALKRLGFDAVFDTNFAADLTIMEEGTELIDRINNDGKLPLFTSCSPGWIKFIEHFYPEYLDNLSSAKSPQQMFGAVAKSYYAKEAGIDSDKIVVVSIMPCTAKKFEAKREEMAGDVDYVLTTRELASIIKSAGIDFLNLEESEYDELLGVSSGAADIFGTTGGVMEAALRTATELITGEELGKIEFEAVRGLEGIKKAEVEIGGLKLRAAVANGLGNARKVMEMIKDGEEFDFIEFMACPGGCMGGGGQPISSDKNVLEKRQQAIYKIDKSKKMRKSHENPYIKKLYDNYLEKPGSEIAHKLLHTKYKARKI
ncbi:NAD(P)-dependent iron-only hydrogenase catalytic subunit [Halanaerobium saccharolyticum]|uniref:NAD(P)-dependent iron-only hydrogenase catalytic subunit n=1 Tax=Halanaerobium saccharolyticum TaxID=43595 RepID=A0A4R7Z5W2_9FIRM|nr:NADH-dependent [FeFe] hydrogenase, group A6 [Halanaerobium saccharolyticum]RAK10539.1 NAD(P)-dependent iron-only hydrogenase catalytic subunit [Halanaerobium saccharolyticum]TDW06704.1 NAD(P)-dependent iron-only hydrogenase catalytic subunit [Halanaerobium saccharolyticum]TDX62339.1 NAD(P)-dependent iron-only hydrogenase catalytic subunit [Halanaerobium saccharolyticum]